MPLGYHHPQHLAYSGPMGGKGTKTGSSSGSSGSSAISAEAAELASKLLRIAGFKLTDTFGNKYEVLKIVVDNKTMGGIKKTQRLGGGVATLGPRSATFVSAARFVLAEKAKASTAKSGSKAGSTSGSTGGSTGSGAQAPSWASALYLAEIKALIGTTLPSNVYPNLSFVIKEGTVGGVAAPVISVTPTGGTVTDVTPDMAQWSDTASQVLAAKSAKDAGTSASGSSSGTTVVTTDTSSSGGSAAAPSSEQALADQAIATVDEAVAEVETPAPSDAMTVSSSAAAATTGEEGFFAKYKWWIAGGVVLAGGYAYMHKQNAAKYPLPEFLSKMVK